MRAPSFAAARHYKMLIKAYFGIDVNMMDTGMLDVEKKGIVMLELKDSDVSKQLLRETGLLKVKQGRDSGIADPIRFVQRFIDFDREEREKWRLKTTC